MRKGSLIRFLAVGAINTLTGLFFIWIGKDLAGLSDITANCVGYAVGLTVSFTLNKRWTFGFRGELISALLRFLGVFLVSYLANLITVVSLLKLTPMPPILCQSCGVIPYSTLFYSGCRWLVFPAHHPGRVAIHRRAT